MEKLHAKFVLTARHYHRAGPQSGRRTYIHELADWPSFRWDEEAIAPLLEHAHRRQVEVVANATALKMRDAFEATVRNLTDSAIATSRIEGEHPDPKAVETTIRRRITAAISRTSRGQRHEPGIAVVTVDTTINHPEPLTVERLHRWHRRLFPGSNPTDFSVGRWRDDRLGPMRVVSGGPIGRLPVIHFEAPAAERLDGEMNVFLDWFNRPAPAPDLLRAAIAHLWFVTIHPYDDCNGRIARATTDLALARCDGTDRRSYSMSVEIMRQRDRYYRALEDTQSGSMDITGWLFWFLDCLTVAMNDGKRTALAVQNRAKMRVFAEANGLNNRQVKFIDG